MARAKAKTKGPSLQRALAKLVASGEWDKGKAERFRARVGEQARGKRGRSATSAPGDERPK